MSSKPDPIFLRNLFEQASDLPEDKRQAFLEAQCQGETEILQQVLELFDARKAAPRFLQPKETVYDSPSSEAPLEDTGTEVGNYRLIRTLGEGGFGVVYLAEQQNPVKRRVALKILKPGMDTKQMIDRFEAERQVLAMMEHPNIAKFHDAGSSDSGRSYFVMELVEGLPITEYCDHKSLSIDQRLSLFVRVCLAIQHAHQKGIIHRDLKPSNVLVAEQDGIAVPKVIDFGIAKATDQQITQATVFTQLGQFLGTPAYVSPEQAGPNTADIDTRTDVYSLGALLYVLLSGKKPFENNVLFERGLEAMRKEIREQEPPKPSTAVKTSTDEDKTRIAGARSTQPEKLTSMIQGELDWIVMKAMEKDRERRYCTANALRIDIERYEKGEAVDAAAPSIIYRLGKILRRHRVAAIFVSAFVCLLLTSTAIMTSLAMSEKRAKVESHRQRYVSDVKAAHLYLTEGDISRAYNLLSPYLPERLAAGMEDPRGIEFRYLWNLAQGEQSMVLEGHNRSVPHLDFSHDGTLLASAGADKTVRIWDWESKEELQVLPIAAAGIEVEFSFDSHYLVARTERIIYVFHREGQQFAELTSIESPSPVRIALSPTHPLLVIRREDGTLEIRTLSDLPNREAILAPSSEILRGPSPAFSHDGKHLANQAKKTQIHILDTVTFDIVATIDHEVFFSGSSFLRFSPDGTWLGAFGSDTPSQIWNCADNYRSVEGIEHLESVLSVQYSPDNQRIAMGHDDQSVTIRDASTLRLIRHYRGHWHQVHSLAFTPDGRWLVTGGQEGRILVWDLESQPATNSFDAEFLFNVSAMEYSPTQSTALLQLGKGRQEPTRTMVWDARLEILDTETMTSRPLDHPKTFVSWFPDGQHILSVESEGGETASYRHRRWDYSHIRTYDLEGNVVREVRLHSEGIYASIPVVNFNSGLLAIGLVDGSIRLFDLESGELISDLDGLEAPVFQLQFAPNGRTLVSSNEESHGDEGEFKMFSAVHIWNINRPATVPSPIVLDVEFGSQPSAIRFSPDSRLLALGRFDGTITIWSCEERQEVVTLKTHGWHVIGMDFSPDGRTLVSGSFDKLIFWNVPTWRELMTISTTGKVGWVDISPQGNSIAYLTSPSSVWEPRNGWILSAPYQ